MVHPLPELIGDSPAIAALREQIERLVSGMAGAHRLPPVLLRGETGTGKGLLARLLHRLGPRAHGPFVDVNCAAIPDTLLEAEMFGFERGAFTDARQAKPGLFQTAHRGTIFLDEVGLLPEGLQGKLLKVIEEQSVRRLGGTRSEPVDVWILAATSGTRTAATLREDLYHRLAVVTLWQPPLRERGEDVVLLAERFLARACADYGLPAKRLAPDTRHALLAHAWPGNVRELMNVMERVALLSSATTATAGTLGLPSPVSETPRVGSRSLPAPDGEGPTAERLLQALRETGWNVSRAAARLATTRSTVRYRIRKLGLRPDASPPPVPAEVPRAPGDAPETARPRWETRHITLLRVLLGAIDSPTDPIETTPIVHALVGKVESFGGRVEDVSARGLVAAFGFEPAEDAPWRAAQAAMAIRKVVERSTDVASAPVPVRIGIHGGRFRIIRLAATTAIDLDDKTEAWDLLDGLVSQTEPNAIRISQAVAPFLERRFELAAAPDIGEVRTYRLAGQDRPGFTLGGRITRYVGRRSEREMLQARLTQARTGRGQVVAIAGEAGIGKSRLLFEFRQQVVGEAVTCLEGRCLSYGSGVAYLPVLDLLRGVCGITEADSLAVIPEKVRAHLAALRIDPAGVLPLLLNLLSLREGTESLAGLTPDAIKVRTFEALRELLVRASESRPSVVIVEDLHWIDGISEEFIASLVEGVPASAILLLVTYRSGYRPRWINKSYVSQVALLPLSPDESLQVVSGVLQRGTVPEALARLVLAKADGNPFFIEELARAVAPDAELTASAVVPDTVQGLLMSRIDRLATQDRRVLQTAAAIGKYFPSTLLGTTGGLSAPDLDATLARLQEAEFVFATSTGPEPRYAFKHPLTHEVAYASLQPDARRALHARIVDAVERQYAERLEEHVEALAHHALRGEAWEKAARYLHRAGDRAFRRSANQDAVAYLEQAMGACERVGERREFAETAVDVRVLLQLALFTLGEHARIGRALLEAETLAEALGDRARQARVANCLATHYYVMGDHAEGLRAARRGLALAETLEDRGTRIGLLIRLGLAHHARAEFSEGAATLRRSLDLLVGEPGYEYHVLSAIPSVHARTWLVWCLADVGEFDEATARAREARETAEARGHPYSQVMAAWGFGYCHLARGRIAPAISAFEESLALCRTSSNIHWTPRVAASLGYAYALAGRVDEGLPLLERGTSEADRIGLRACSPLLIAWLGEAYRAAGRGRHAAEAARRAVDRARRQGERGHEAYALRLLAEIEQSEEQYREAIELAETLGMRPLLGRCHLGLSRLLEGRGHDSQAEQHAGSARRLFADLAFQSWPAGW